MAEMSCSSRGVCPLRTLVQDPYQCSASGPASGPPVFYHIVKC